MGATKNYSTKSYCCAKCGTRFDALIANCPKCFSESNPADAAWHDEPPVPGVYYCETYDVHGDPRPGLALREDGKTWEPSSIPTRYFGPIVGAMQRLTTDPTT